MIAVIAVWQTGAARIDKLHFVDQESTRESLVSEPSDRARRSAIRRTKSKVPPALLLASASVISECPSSHGCVP